LLLAPQHTRLVCLLAACANSDECAGVKAIVQQQRRQGVAGSFLSGLQHDLAEAAAPWITAVFGKDEQDPVYPNLDETSFGSDDSGSLSSATDGAEPGLPEVSGSGAARRHGGSLMQQVGGQQAHSF
jgi:hypothetical protein